MNSFEKPCPLVCLSKVYEFLVLSACGFADLFRALEMVTPKQQLILLKCLKNLSVSPAALESIQNCYGAINTLSIFLSHKESTSLKDLRNQALYIIFNFCRINKHRRTLAASAGVVPSLLYIVSINNPLKQFALPILCDLAHTNTICRVVLWENGGLEFYLSLLGDFNNTYWQINALEAILSW